jgi:alkanesulfonate monooxygenase SsuD/methylene tetrahydromethanopterin reductase-like flavin-dependent oxidoreductase (luciferase family)
MPPRAATVGLGLPQVVSSVDDVAGYIGSYARAAEALGYGSLWVAESPPAAAALDSLAVLTVAAANTTRPRLGTAVLVLPLYEPITLARTVATIDRISGGRLLLGVGLGGVPGLETAFGGHAGDRLARTLASVELMRALWTGDAVIHADEFRRLEGLSVGVTPVAQRVPILIGASAPPALRRAGRIGDGWICSARAPREVFAEQYATVTEACAADHADFTVVKRTYVAVQQDDSDIDAWFRATLGVAAPPYDAIIRGDVDEIEAGLRALVSAGADELAIQPVGLDPLAQATQLAQAGVVARMGTPNG